jgi:hypothetical protein
MESLGITVALPFVVCISNIRVIFMAENAFSGVHISQIDTRYYFIREHVKDGFIKIWFVRTMENDMEIFTENVSKGIYENILLNV